MSDDIKEMPKEHKDDVFIGEFSKISTEHILRQYEAKHRERIASASLTVRDAFDKQWIKVTGKGYYQPVTTVPVIPVVSGQNNTQRSDPRSRRYRAETIFTGVDWQRLSRRKIGKKFKDLYNLKGVDSQGEERPIFQNLDSDQLSRVLGQEIRDKIIQEKMDHGEVSGPFKIEVEGYWEVIFAPQSSPNDTRDVQLLWEGQCLLMQRMKEVVLPGFYLEVADHATRDHYTQEPNQGRKKVGTIQVYPYTVLREATRAEYLERKSEGDRIQREKLMREENM